MQSSVEKLGSFSLSIPRLRAYSLTFDDTAVRKPVKCIPPSIVLMLFAYE